MPVWQAQFTTVGDSTHCKTLGVMKARKVATSTHWLWSASGQVSILPASYQCSGGFSLLLPTWHFECSPMLLDWVPLTTSPSPHQGLSSPKIHLHPPPPSPSPHKAISHKAGVSSGDLWHNSVSCCCNLKLWVYSVMHEHFSLKTIIVLLLTKIESEVLAECILHNQRQS